MDTRQNQIIEQEIHHLSGWLCDLYRRVAENASERAGEIAGALQANAWQFAEILSGTH